MKFDLYTEIWAIMDKEPKARLIKNRMALVCHVWNKQSNHQDETWEEFTEWIIKEAISTEAITRAARRVIEDHDKIAEEKWFDNNSKILEDRYEKDYERN